jgi:general secretion pathway protein B
MSYILEALASSEQARQQVPAAPKYSLLPVVGEQAARRRFWPYAVAGVLVVNASVLYFLARPAPLPEVQIAAPAAGTTPSQAPPQPQPQRVAEPVIVQAPAPVIVRAPAPIVAAAKTEPKKPEPKKPEPKKPEPVAKVAAPRPASPPEASTLPPPPAEAVSRFELPTGLQREVPALSVSGYIREEGSSGMVIVNDKLLHEGDELVPGLKLEKILQDSLVFNYKGYRFKP